MIAARMKLAVVAAMLPWCGVAAAALISFEEEIPAFRRGVDA